MIRSARPRRRPDAPRPGAPQLEPPVDSLLQAADRLRDAGRVREAMAAYEGVLERAPQRIDVAVQRANMLKDSGHPGLAEAAYRTLLLERPDSADLHLQLGHALKMQGARGSALAAYQQAAAIDPDSEAALRELAAAGQAEHERLAFALQLRAGGLEAMMAVSHELAVLRRRLDEMARILPDLQSWTAFPIEAYASLREAFDVPPPQAAPGTRRFGVVLLADGEPLESFHAQLAALREQSHPAWRLFAIGREPAWREAIERAAPTDPRLSWIETDPAEPPAAAELRAATTADTEWLLLPAPGAVLHPHALAWMATAATLGPADAFVCDEETGEPDRGRIPRSSPVLRQAVDHDTLLEANVYGETVAVRRAAFLDTAGRPAAGSLSAARSALLLALSRNGRVGHVPYPLAWRPHAPAADPQAHRDAVAAHLAATGLPAAIDLDEAAPAPSRLPIRWRASEAGAGLTVVVATRDNAADLEVLVASLRRTAARPQAVQVLVVDNGSDDPNRRRLARLAADGSVRVLEMPEPFNWPRLNNRAARLADTPFLVFANDDMQMRTPGWDRILLGLLQRPGIGAVGARLIYPDETIQHAGVLFGWRGSVIHDGQFEPMSAPGPAGRWQLSRAVGAVTGAFLATPRALFTELGGFDEAALPVAYNDVDYCLRLRQAGRKVLWTPDLTLVHYESKSRGHDFAEPAKAARNLAELAALRSRWGDAMGSEPGMHPAWHAATRPFRLLSMPSEAQARQHIIRCADPDPWRVPPP